VTKIEKMGAFPLKLVHLGVKIKKSCGLGEFELPQRKGKHVQILHMEWMVENFFIDIGHKISTVNLDRKVANLGILAIAKILCCTVFIALFLDKFIFLPIK
jgi:hypothetical protein